MEYITMNHKERHQSKLFEQIITRKITQKDAAIQLGISDRWVRKKLKRYREENDLGLIHKGRGRTSKHRWDDKEQALTIDLLKNEWRGFGPTFTSEKLAEVHKIDVSRETLRNMMIKHGLWDAKKCKVRHRRRRERKLLRGMMVQLDGSPHDWFEGRAPRCTLIVFIDDATSEILWLEFAASESTHSLMQATKNYIEKHGIPRSFYVDHGSVFHINLNNIEGEKKTQWERACQQLKIVISHANSPQAKGRVERCNSTMQDRLVKEMRLAGINSMNAANNYLKESDFIEKHNKKFSVSALQSGNAHHSCDLFDLSDVFSVQEKRVLAKDFTVVYEKKIFQLLKEQIACPQPGEELVVKIRLDGSIDLFMRGINLNWIELSTLPQKPALEDRKYNNNIVRKPPEASRRWASGNSLPKNERTYTLIESRVKPASPDAEANQCTSK